MRVIVKGAYAKVVEGKEHLKVLQRILRIKNPAYGRGSFGNSVEKFIHYLDRTAKTFPAGLIPMARKKLEAHGITLDASYPLQPIDEKVENDCLNEIILRPYQVQATTAGLRSLRCIIEAGTGAGKSACAAALCHYLLKTRNFPILVLVPSRHLVNQTAAVLSKFLGKPVGIVGDGKRDTSHQVTVATGQTMVKGTPGKMKWDRKSGTMRKQPPSSKQLSDFIGSVKSLILDECHRQRTDGWKAIGHACQANIRIGLTATFQELSLADRMSVKAHTGNVVFSLKSDKLIKMGKLAKPTVYVLDDAEAFGPAVPTFLPPKKEEKKTGKRRMPSPYARSREGADGEKLELRSWHEIYSDSITNNKYVNLAVARVAKKALFSKHPPLIMVQQVNHIKNLCKAMDKLEVPYKFLTGRDTISHRLSVIEGMLKTGAYCVCSTGLFDEGVDLPALSCVILAGGGKSRVKLVQRVGRALRPKPGENTAYIVDFTHTHNSITAKHSKERVKECKRQNWEIKRCSSINQIFK